MTSDANIRAECNSALPGDPAVPRLQVTNLAKGYPGQQVLEGLELSLAPGEVLAIRGQSGTGKSTLLHCLGLLDRPDRGEIRLDGQTVHGLAPAAAARVRAERIGFVFQAFHLLPDFTVAENVRMAARCAGDPAGAGGRVDELLARVGLAAKAGADVRKLSGGERQRVALCRALLNRPGLVLADEPTGNLDPVTAGVVLDELIDLARTTGAAVILVTHDEAVATRADRILHLWKGRLHTPEDSAQA